jgi:uncharacterized protein YdeI (YjbR/CyaY-like superfamily)
MGPELYFADRTSWRAWLSENHDKAKEVWLLYPKKTSGKPRILYNDAVEEALCFGWIDSTVKRIDEHFYAQRFTPRNPRSKYSEANKQRLRVLVKQGMVIPSILVTLGEILDEEFVVPYDILKALQVNKQAWENYQRFSPEYRRIRIAYIEGARNRPEEFEKRLRHFLRMTDENKQFGFGGIEKHY